MKFERRKLSDLRPAEYNPRKKLTPEDKEYQDIKRSILEFGYADPIVINFDGTIIKGHQRRTVMMDLGYEDAEVIVLDIQDKTKEKALNTALNGRGGGKPGFCQGSLACTDFADVQNFLVNYHE